MRPRVSPDGKYVYYAKLTAIPTSIWKAPIDGGAEVEVLDASHGVDQFAVARKGIYFTPEPMLGGSRSLMFHNESAGETKQVAVLEQHSKQCSSCLDWIETGLTISHDGKLVLYGNVDHFGSDLMLVENFR